MSRLIVPSVLVLILVVSYLFYEGQTNTRDKSLINPETETEDNSVRFELNHTSERSQRLDQPNPFLQAKASSPQQFETADTESSDAPTRIKRNSSYLDSNETWVDQKHVDSMLGEPLTTDDGVLSREQLQEELQLVHDDYRQMTLDKERMLHELLSLGGQIDVDGDPFFDVDLVKKEDISRLTELRDTLVSEKMRFEQKRTAEKRLDALLQDP